jgi:hypothetical protein
MSTVRLKLDVAGTRGDEAFRAMRHFDQIEFASFGPQYGFGDATHPRGFDGACAHDAAAQHPRGEWIGAEVHLSTPLLAQYAVSHYLQQPRVLDADVIE